MPFANRLVGSIVLGVLAVVMLVVFSFAVASLLRISSGGGVLTPDAAADVIGDAVAAPEAAPSISELAFEGVGIATLDCRRSTADTTNDLPFMVIVGGQSSDPDPLAVAVDLIALDGSHQSRVVTFPLTAASPTIEATVPDSFDPSFGSCKITAVQRGERILITGN